MSKVKIRPHFLFPAVLSALVASAAAIAYKIRKTRAPLKLYRIQFSQGEFAKLAKPEQLFLLRLAHIRNDLRHIFYMCVAAERGTRSESAIERKLVMHQLLFYLRLIYGTLEEAWKVIHSAWDGERLHATLDSLLTPEGKDALRTIKRYFSRTNLARTIRDKFAFHYEDEPLDAPLARRPDDQVCEIITGVQSGNVFHAFAEDIRAEAMLMTVRSEADGWSEAEIRASVVKLYEGYQDINRAISKFSDEILVGFTKRIRREASEFTQTRVTDFRKVFPILFVDEESLKKLTPTKDV
jgi:hypothetical protein